MLPYELRRKETVTGRPHATEQGADERDLRTDHDTLRNVESADRVLLHDVNRRRWEVQSTRNLFIIFGLKQSSAP